MMVYRYIFTLVFTHVDNSNSWLILAHSSRNLLLFPEYMLMHTEKKILTVKTFWISMRTTTFRILCKHHVLIVKNFHLSKREREAPKNKKALSKFGSKARPPVSVCYTLYLIPSIPADLEISWWCRDAKRSCCCWLHFVIFKGNNLTRNSALRHEYYASACRKLAQWHYWHDYILYFV